MAVTRSWSSNCRIVKSSKVSSSVGSDGPAFMKKLGPTCGGSVNFRGGGRADIVVGGNTSAIRRAIISRMGGHRLGSG